MNDFYKQPKVLIWIEAILLLLVGSILALFLITKGATQPLVYLLFILYVPISQFLFTPLFKLTGIYTYYSPMLLGYMSTKEHIDLHSGTGFDYFFVFKKTSPRTSLRNRIMVFHLEGLLRLIQEIEDGHLPLKINITGTSYFFNERTLKKIGFQITSPSLFYRINLFINIIDLCWMYSLAKGKITIPALWDAKKAMITGKDLVSQKTTLEALYMSLMAKQSLKK